MTLNDTKTFTYQSRPFLDEFMENALNSYAELYGFVERHLFSDFSRGLNILSLKSSYLVEFGITARQFNACRVSLEGKIDSIKQLRIEQISQLKERIDSLKKKIPKIKSKKVVHQKKRSLASIELKLLQLEKEYQTGSISLCFGTRKLFHAQYNLEANGYDSFKDWKKDWEESRNSEFFCIGSKDETAGNQSSVLTFDENKKGTLRIRLPNALVAKLGKYLVITNIAFNYGYAEIAAALKENRALSYRFKKDEKGWRVFISFSQERAEVVTKERNGAIGVDVNVNHIAIVETDAKGNPIYKESIPLNTYGKTQNQAKALIGDVCRKIVALAKEKKKPLVVERLDFKKKKRALKETLSKYARMLSSFHYSQFLEGLSAKSFREGVGFFQVNPAMTSVIGRFKFSFRYGLSTHHAAALCIARRHYNFSEAPTKSAIKVVYKNLQVTCPSPVRKRGQHVWSFWKEAKRKVTAALAAHSRAHRSPCSA